jgi:hypothetical protein
MDDEGYWVGGVIELMADGSSLVKNKNVRMTKFWLTLDILNLNSFITAKYNRIIIINLDNQLPIPLYQGHNACSCISSGKIQTY